MIRYIGDEYGFLYVLKFDAEEGNLQQLPYYIAANVIAGNTFGTWLAC